MNANRLKRTHSQVDRALPLSELMKAAIVLAMATLLLALVLASVISSGFGTLTSAVKAEAIGTYAGFGGFAGGILEDTRDLD